jgi:hypothetical protein
VTDLVFLVATVAFFAVALAYVAGCDRLAPFADTSGSRKASS